MPHAYTTAADGKRLLRRQLEAMRDGGVVAITVPSNPYRCPPAPYERACMIAHYLKTRKTEVQGHHPRSEEELLQGERLQGGIREILQGHHRAEPNRRDRRLRYRQCRCENQGDRHQGRQDGKGGRGQHHPAAARRRDCAQGRRRRRRLVPCRYREFRVQGGQGRVRTGRLGHRQRNAEGGAYAANSQAKAVVADILAELAGKEKIPRTPILNICWSPAGRPTTASRSEPPTHPRTASSSHPAHSCHCRTRLPKCARRTPRTASPGTTAPSPRCSPSRRSLATRRVSRSRRTAALPPGHINARSSRYAPSASWPR